MKKLLLIAFALWLGLSQVGSAMAATATYLTAAQADVVNQDGTTFATNSTTVWLGNASSTTTSYTGIRFTNVSIPSGAVVTSAKIRVYSTKSQWISIAMSMAGELTPSSAVFSSASKPSQRVLTAQKVAHTSNTNWAANTWYVLDEMAPVVQEIVNQAGWKSGNSLALILKGTGRSWGRKTVAGWAANPNNGPQLLITYTTSAGTATVAPPTATAVPPDRKSVV